MIWLDWRLLVVLFGLVALCSFCWLLWFCVMIVGYFGLVCLVSVGKLRLVVFLLLWGIKLGYGDLFPRAEPFSRTPP